jgi:hypothetical protein
MGAARRRPAVNVTLPRGLREAYEEAAASHTLPSLSSLLEHRMVEQLELLGWPLPPREAPAARTAAATAAQVQARRERAQKNRR